MSISGNLNSAALSDLLALITLIENTDEFKKRIQEIQVKREEAEKAIALVGPAQEIPALREAALKDREAATAFLNNAKQEAADVLATSSRQIEGLQAALKKESDTAYEAIKLERTALDNERAKLVAEASQLTADKANLAGKQKELDALIAGNKAQAEALTRDKAAVEAEKLRIKEKYTAALADLK